MSRHTEYKYKLGSRLVVELIPTTIIEGTVVCVAKNCISMWDIVTYPDNSKMRGGPYHFYRSEIKSIRILNEPLNKGDTKKLIEHPDMNKNMILMPKVDYEDLRKMTQEYIYISMIDTNYYNALQYLETCENLGVTGITESYDTFAPLSLLVMSSWDQVYIFDIYQFSVKAFPKQLKDILESQHITKVVHDARLLWGVLKNQYKVELTNVFDTMCSDVTIQHKKNGEKSPRPATRGIGECFKHYFHFPESFVEVYKNMETRKWDKRPLCNDQKLQASQLCSYLVYLKNHLEYLMLKSFFNTSTAFMESFSIPLNINIDSDAQKIVDIYKKEDC